MLKTIAVTIVVGFWLLSLAAPLESYSAENATQQTALASRPRRGPASVTSPMSLVSTPEFRKPVARDAAWLTPKNSPDLSFNRRWRLLRENPSLQAWGPGGFGDSTGNIWKSKYFQTNGYHWLP